MDTHRTWAEIDLSALEHNYRAVTARLGNASRLICVVKADAYGHGAPEVARRLEAIGADTFAVATADEAFELRGAGITRPILVLGVSPPRFARELAEHNITQTVHELSYARELSRAASGKTLVVHIKLDTGMGRMGFQGVPDASEAARLPNLRAEGIFTHFSMADEPGADAYTAAQYHMFTRQIAEIEADSGVKFNVRHCANSGAVLNFPEYCPDMSRVGLLLYGYAPFETAALDLIPVMQLKTRVTQIKTLSPGDRVSYGGVYTAARAGKAAVLPVGYADGLHRALSGKLGILIRGKPAPQIGRICMDMCVADVTDVPDAEAGDEAVIFGRAPAVDAREAAEIGGTIPYEILCAVSARVPRVYV